MHRSAAGSGDDTVTVCWPYQSVVVLSENYMNFRIHLGLDLLTVEAYLSDQVKDNYIAFGCQADGSESTPELRERRTDSSRPSWATLNSLSGRTVASFKPGLLNILRIK